MLNRLRKPRWQHNKASVRLKAIDLLDAELPEQHQILETLARGDSDSAVRCAAIAQLKNFVNVFNYYRNDSDQAVRDTAYQRLLQLLSDDSPLTLENRLRYIRLLDDNNLLVALIPHSHNASCLTAIIEQLSDQQQLLNVALTAKTATLRIDAAILLPMLPY